MYRVPSSRRRRVFRSLKPWLATLLVLPALVFHGIAIRIYIKLIRSEQRFESHNLLQLTLSAIGIVCSVAFVYGVARKWPSRVLFLGAGIILLTLGFIGFELYASISEHLLSYVDGTASTA